MGKVKVFLEMIKFEHTIFALPFAYFGAFLAAGGFPSLAKFVWITLAMIGARTAAMSLNRLIDRFIDAKNPRTMQRAIPAGLLKAGEVYVYTILSFVLLGISAYKLNMLAFKLMPAAVFVLVFYSYTKRFTWGCHLFLGLALGIAPIGAWVGITGSLALLPIVLGLGVMLWVAGFDIIYACQDVEFDIKEGLHSIPSIFGLNKALRISASFHIIALMLFFILGIMDPILGIAYYLGVIIAAVLLYRQHKIVSSSDLSKIGVAFFNLNAYLSVELFVFAFLDLVIIH